MGSHPSSLPTKSVDLTYKPSITSIGRFFLIVLFPQILICREHIVIILYLIWREQSIPDLLCVERVRDLLEFASELRLHLSLAQRGQEISVVWRLLQKGHRCCSLAGVASQEFSKADNLIEEEHGVQVAISLPDKAGADLAEGLSPLLNSESLVLVQSDTWTPLLVTPRRLPTS